MSKLRDLQGIDSLIHNYFSVDESEGGFPNSQEWAEKVLRDIRTITEKYTNQEVKTMPETLPECPHCGESGVFDSWVVLNDGNRYARYSCSACETLFDITEAEYKQLREAD